MRILIVPDIDGWAVENMADNIIRVLGDKFEFTKMFAEKSCESKGLPVFDFDKIDEYYFNYDLIYIMLPSYLKRGMDVERTITTFHGGPGTEGQADQMQRFGLSKMRTSYVSKQVKDRVTKYVVEHSSLIPIEKMYKVKNVLQNYNIKMDTVKNIRFKRSNSVYKVYICIQRIGYDLENLFFTPHGVNLESYPLVEMKDDKLICGYAGWTKYFLGKQSNHRRCEWIMNAIKEKEFSLMVAGGLQEHIKDDLKDFEEKYKNLLLYRDIKIKPYSKNEMKDFYKDINCYLVPDKWAGGPMPVLEAGASGIPSICTNAGLCGDVVTHMHNGYMVDDLFGFMEGIEFMQNNPYERKRMGENMRSFIEKHRTWETVAPDWEAFFLGEKCEICGDVTPEMCNELCP